MLLLGSAAMCGGSVSASEGSVSPYKRGLSEMEYGPIRDGKVRGCPTVNPNCVSTSSLNPRTYASPWTTPADVKDLSEAKAVLVDLMLSPSGFGCKLLEEQSSDPPGQWEYVRLSTPSGRFGEDQMEFVLTRKTLDRNWQGDSQLGLLVFFRSMTSEIRYIYPIQQPVSDFGAQEKRLKRIRDELGWRLVGCELIECYE